MTSTMFSPESAVAAPSQFDTAQIDRNLRQLSTLDQSTRMPALPDAVKLDLASMPGATEDSLLEMMLGLDGDLNDEEEDEPSDLILPGQGAPPQTGMDQLQIVLAGVSNNPPPQQITEDAVQMTKRRMIDDGYLDMDPSKVDGTWSPELNRIRGEYAFDQYNRSLRDPMAGIGIGKSDEPGTVMQLLNDFTSPSGLLSAATELDFLPDFNAIGREFSTWGDKWREVAASENPVEFAGNLFDALTGPIDDIVFPVLNTALLFTGVGAIANSARVGWQGTRLLRAGSLFERLYSGSGLGARAGSLLMGGRRLASNLDLIGEAGWLSGRLAGSSGAMRQGLGRGMAAWRAWTPARASKTVVQQGMRLGFAQELESRVGSYQGGQGSLTEDGVPILESAKMSPLALPFEVLLAPYNIFSPGTFIGKTGGISTTGRAAFRALGTTGGRTAVGGLLGGVAGAVTGDDAGDIAKGALTGGALGAGAPLIGKGLQNRTAASAVKGAVAGAVAGAWLGDGPEDVALGAFAGAGLFAVTDTARLRMFDQVGEGVWNRAIRGLGTKMVQSSFIPLADDQQISLAFDRAMRWRFRDTPDKLNTWVDDVERKGVRGALQTIQGGSDETAAGTIGFTFVSAMIDWIATAQASVVKGQKGWRYQYHANRNKLINQLRSYDLSGGLTDGMLDDLATSIAFTEKGGGDLAKVYKYRVKVRKQLAESPEKALELANGHNMRAAETIRQLTNPTNFPKLLDDGLGEIPLADKVGLGLGEAFSSSMNTGSLDGRGWVMQKYMDQIGDTFGDYPKFVGATDQVQKARLAGIFDGAKLKGFVSRFGTEKSVLPGRRQLPQDEAAAVNAAVTDHLLNNVDAAKIGNVNATPLASPHAPGVVTVAKWDTKVKHEYQELAEEVRDLIDVRDHLGKIGNRQQFGEDAARLLGVDADTKLTDLTSKQIEAILEQFGPAVSPPAPAPKLFGHFWEPPAPGTSLGAAAMANRSSATAPLAGQVPKAAGEFLDSKVASKKASRYILDFARRKGLSIGELDIAITAMADDLADRADTWRAFGFDEFVFNDQGKALKGFDALQARLGEINEKLPFVAAQIDTDDLLRYLDELDPAQAAEARALVDGLDGDGYKLVHGVEFLMPEDLAHGPIFKDVTRRHLNGATFGNAFKGKLPVEALLLEDRRHRLVVANALSKANLGDYKPDDPYITRIVFALQDFLKHKQRPMEDLIRDYHLTPPAERATGRLRTITTPIRVDDLSRHGKELQPWLVANAGLTPQEAEKVWDATHRFRATKFEDVGLYGLEAKLRSTNIAEWGLKTLTGSKYAEGWTGKVGGLLPAAGVGAVYGAAQTAGQDLSFEERLKAAATGAAVGAAGLGAVRVGASALNRGVGMLPGKTNLVDRAAHMQYGYLADHLAQWRDSLRFTLSPFFDLSRYTEGLFLAQTAAPLRGAKGERMQLPLNMTPHGLRRALRKEGLSTSEAMAQYQTWVAKFQNFAKTRGDFDAEVLDSTGRWFKQMGILGFSPTDWMGTAFAHLVRSGLSEEQAYQGARQMYTYGVRGRSAAEMSVNFIMFPFSFQKKALTHMAKWMNNDLSRSIIIHDAMRTYQLLDEHFNLDERWKSHIPFLQQMQRLNLFAYGLSPGRFGGMNSQLFESVGKVGWNMFVPVGLEINDVQASEEAKDVWRNLAPVFNDVNWMMKNLKESGHVAFSDSHVTTAAEIRMGYEEWYDFKEGFERELADKGYKLEDVFNKPWLQEALAFYKGKEAELSDKFPAWAQSKQEFIGNIVMDQTARKLHGQRVELALAEGRTPKPDDFMVYQFEQLLEQLKDQAELFTGSRDIQEAPMEYINELHRVAAEFARENPQFMSLYGTYFERELGPIQLAMRITG